jgi:hypothetical protein
LTYCCVEGSQTGVFDHEVVPHGVVWSGRFAHVWASVFSRLDCPDASAAAV